MDRSASSNGFVKNLCFDKGNDEASLRIGARG
jgi:hypothetical protein